MHYELLAEKTRYLKENPEGVSEMCKVMEELRNESYAEGREEGREQQAKATAIRMSKRGRFHRGDRGLCGFRLRDG